MTQKPEHIAIQTMDDDMISLSEIAGILFRGKRWIIGSTLIFLMGALLYLGLVNPTWRVSTLIKVDYNQSELILSLLGLREVKVEKPTVTAEIEQIKTFDFIRQSLKNDNGLLPDRVEVTEFLGRFTIKEKARDTGIIEIAVTGADPARSVDELNRINEYFIEQSNSRLSGTLDRAITVLNNRVASLKLELKEAEERQVGYLERDKDVASGATRLRINDQSTEYLIESRMAEAQTRYADALHQRVQLKQARELAESSVYVLSQPAADSQPMSPKYALVLTLAVMLGGMLGVVIVFVREMMRQGLRTAEEVENKTGLTVFATVSASSKPSKNVGLLLSAVDLEGLRVLRTNLLYRLTKATNNRVLICCPASGVGQRYVITHLAMLLSEVGKKVLLVDADLRQGDLYNYFDVSVNKSLSEGLADADDAVMATVNDYLDLISGDSYPDNPSELLMSKVCKELLERTSSQYDVVLIHVPPVLEVTDAAVVGAQCNTSLMVVRSEQTTEKEIEAAGRRLKQAGVCINGCVFTEFDALSL